MKRTARQHRDYSFSFPLLGPKRSSVVGARIEEAFPSIWFVGIISSRLLTERAQSKIFADALPVASFCIVIPRSPVYQVQKRIHNYGWLGTGTSYCNRSRSVIRHGWTAGDAKSLKEIFTLRGTLFSLLAPSFAGTCLNPPQ